MSKPNIDLGVKVRDVVTGIEGVTVACTKWFTQCNSYGIDIGPSDKGEKRDLYWVDEPRLEVLNSKRLTLPGHIAEKASEVAG